MSKITIFLPKLEDCLSRYQEGDETISSNHAQVVDSLPTAKRVLENRLTLLQAQLQKLKLKDISCE